MEVGLKRRSRGVILGREGIIDWRGAGWRRVVEVYVEQQMMIIAIWIPFLEFARDGSVGGADVVVHDFTKNSVGICNLA